jgi:hypothetical protein
VRAPLSPRGAASIPRTQSSNSEPIADNDHARGRGADERQFAIPGILRAASAGGLKTAPEPSDKQIVRDWLSANWDRTGDPPAPPATDRGADRRLLPGVDPEAHRLVIVRKDPWSDPGVMALREEMRIEIEAQGRTPRRNWASKAPRWIITAFFVAYGDSDRPVGCGALRELTGEVDCEVPVVPPAPMRARRDRSTSSWIHGHPGQPLPE